jgi:hypothetical protein
MNERGVKINISFEFFISGLHHRYEQQYSDLTRNRNLSGPRIPAKQVRELDRTGLVIQRLHSEISPGGLPATDDVKTEFCHESIVPWVTK